MPADYGYSSNGSQIYTLILVYNTYDRSFTRILSMVAIGNLFRIIRRGLRDSFFSDGRLSFGFRCSDPECQ